MKQTHHAEGKAPKAGRQSSLVERHANGDFNLHVVPLGVGLTRPQYRLGQLLELGFGHRPEDGLQLARARLDQLPPLHLRAGGAALLPARLLGRGLFLRSDSRLAADARD